MKKVILLFAFIISISISSYARNKIEDFSIDKSGNCDLVWVHCYFNTDTFKTGNYRWDFGDGTILTFTNSNYATHTYSTPGLYSITFTAIVDKDTSIVFKENVIKVYKGPKAYYEIYPKDSNFYAPFTATFVNKSKAGESNQLIYSWLIDNLSEIHETNPVHTFEEPGIYNIRLKVSDSLECSSNFDTTIIIKDTAQKHERDYITSSCHGKKDEKSILYMDYYIYKDTLKIVGKLDANCCSKKTVTTYREDNMVYVKQFESGNLCTCDCTFDFRIVVPDIFQDSIYFTMDEKIYLAKKRLYDGVGKLNLSELINVSPNPANSLIVVSCPLIGNKPVNISIYDVVGKEVKSQISKGKSEISIDTSELNDGVYFVRLLGKDIYTTKKIVISHE